MLAIAARQHPPVVSAASIGSAVAAVNADGVGSGIEGADGVAVDLTQTGYAVLGGEHDRARVVVVLQADEVTELMDQQAG